MLIPYVSRHINRIAIGFMNTPMQCTIAMREFWNAENNIMRNSGAFSPEDVPKRDMTSALLYERITKTYNIMGF